MNKLDYEAYTHHFFDISITYDNGFVAYVAVVIAVGNINDNKPQLFPYQREIFINPSLAGHTMIGEVDVIDADQPNQRTLSTSSFVFDIVAGNVKSIFGINNWGQIYTKRCMTGTDIGVYELTIRVNDGNLHYVDETVNVHIYDIGDRYFSKSCPVKCSDFGNPVNYMFKEGIKVIEVAEDTLVMKALLTVDINAFPNATYTLSPHTDGYFKIEPQNGTVYLNRSLDYELKRVHYFTVSASIPSRASGVTVESKIGVMVMVKDVEDMSPVVTAPSAISISELTLPGTVVGSIKFTDADTTRSSINISITSQYPDAVLVNLNGELIVGNISKVPHNTPYTLIYSVSDRITSTQTGTIMLQVVDVNNNVPMFTKKIYNFNVKENLANYQFGTVAAKDEDAFDHSVAYSIDQVSMIFFGITTNGTLFTRTKLDYEDLRIHHITVTAHDTGRYVGLAIVTVHVEDENDVTPRFTNGVNGIFSTLVNENMIVGSYVYHIGVVDRDVASNLTFVFARASEYFTIDNTGVVKLSKQLYLDTRNEHQITFSVTDGKNPISGTLQITVDRSSAQQCPVLAGFNTKIIAIDENINIADTILDFRTLITNSHQQNRYQFSLEAGSPRFFEIIGNELRLKANIDYESTPKSFKFNVIAHDSVRNTTTLMPLTIDVNDIDEMPPKITTTEINVSEFTKVNSIVGLISVHDTDGSAKVTYNLTNGDGTFSVDTQTGAITLLKKLDGSVTKNKSLNMCIVSSNVKECKNVTIYVENTNSHSPTFGEFNGTFLLNYQTKIGDAISKHSAKDYDGDDIKYSMNALGDTTVSTIFEVDSTSGHIIIKAATIPGLYRFFLIATDGILSTCIPITIVVPLPNAGQRTPPHFKNPSYSVSVFRDANTILRVEASDPPDTQSIVYSITSGNGADIFEIESSGDSAGIISRRSSAVLVTGNFFHLQVTAKNGRTGLNGTVSVYIAIASPVDGDTPDSFVQQILQTQLTLNLSLANFDQQHVLSYYVIGQQYPGNVDVSVQSFLEPVTYHLVFNSTEKDKYRYRFYYVANISVSDVEARRTKRSVSNTSKHLQPSPKLLKIKISNS